MKTTSNAVRHYLIAEDEPDTTFLIARAFRTLDLATPLHFVVDGQEVIEYLEGVGEFSDREKHPLPALLLLDLQMPRRDGMETLRWLRTSPFRELVVVMFSSSDQPGDVCTAYQAGVNSFIHKPVTFSELIQTLSAIHHYWLGFNCFPDANSGNPCGTGMTGLKVVREENLAR